MTDDTIAASLSDPTGASGQNNGNGENIKTLWNTLNNTKTNLYSGVDSLGAETSTADTISNYADTYVNSIAQKVSATTQSATTSAATVTMYTNAIASVSGVSTDTEMTNMLALQQAYSASAKIITAIQSMYDAIFAAV